MKHTAHFILDDLDEVRRMVAENPWATIVSPTSHGVVASHYPVLLDEQPGDGIALLTHVGRPDDVLHELGQHEILVIIQGAHGYISPSWYESGGFIPTWNHLTAHLYGTPEILSAEENFEVLRRLVDHFERDVPNPKSLSIDEGFATNLAKGTVGMRIPITRIDARRKLSQNKTREDVEGALRGLEGDGPYANPRLAAEMRRVHD
jgi:transcriptional regulator